MAATTRILAVDGNNILIRGIKALEHNPHGQMSAGGVPTGALHIFIRCLARYVRQERPDRLVVCWDGGRSEWRTNIYEGYKAARVAFDGKEDAESPFGLAKRFLTLAGIHHVERAGVEADDLIAYYWRTKAADDRLIILSGDKDFFQLLDGWTEQVSPNDEARWTSNRIRTVMKCKSEHIPLVMALTGDAGDGVPGIPGFGTKTAVKYLSKYDWDLTKLMEANEPKLFGQRDNILRNLALVDLRSKSLSLALEYPPRFAPTGPTGVLWGELLGFLGHYQLASVRDRLQAGDLWTEKVGTA